MAASSSSSSSILLAMAMLAALLAFGSCGSTLSWTIGKDSTSTRLVLVASAAISEVSVKQKDATEWSEDLKESPAKTFTLDSKTPIKGPISVRFAVEGHGYRTTDDVIPDGFKPGSVYQTKEQV